MNCVGVLELIDQDLAKSVLVVGKKGWLLQPELMSTKQQFAEIHHATTFTCLLIRLVDLHHDATELVTIVFQVGGAQALILLLIDEPLTLPRGPLAFIQAKRLIDTLDQSQLVIGIKNLELFRQSGFLPVRTQQPVGEAMEGTYPHSTDGPFQQFFDANPHLVGGFIGERNSQNTPGRCAFHLNEPGNTVHKNTGFTAAGTSEHEQVSGFGGDGLPLGVIEGVQNM